MLKSYWAELKLDSRPTEELQSTDHSHNVDSMQLSVYISLVAGPPGLFMFFPLKYPESLYIAISAETFKKVYDYIG